MKTKLQILRECNNVALIWILIPLYLAWIYICFIEWESQLIFFRGEYFGDFLEEDRLKVAVSTFWVIVYYCSVFVSAYAVKDTNNTEKLF